MKIRITGFEITIQFPIGRVRRPPGFYTKPAPIGLRWPVVIQRKNF